MRWLLILCLSAAPAAAWEFSVEDSVCILDHADTAADVRVSYVPGVAIYGITITRRNATWTPSPTFSIRFQGPRGQTIVTRRQTYGAGGASLTVTDQGFGNVLDGIEFNDRATAALGDDATSFSLAGAAPEVQKFRACATGLSA
ncbi:MAG: hypothetical protein AAFX00_12135 [Pseudomonadota bacterium]